MVKQECLAVLKLWAIESPFDDLSLTNQTVVCVGCAFRLFLSRAQFFRLRMRSRAPFFRANSQWLPPLNFARRHIFAGRLFLR